MSVKQRWLEAIRERENELEILREENKKLKQLLKKLKGNK